MIVGNNVVSGEFLSDNEQDKSHIESMGKYNPMLD